MAILWVNFHTTNPSFMEIFLKLSSHFSQDLFAELRPNMTRYASIEEVNAALVDLEEHERIVTSEKANNEKHSETEKIPSRTTSGMSVNGQSLSNGIEENGLHEEVVETESDSENGTIEHVAHDDDEETDDWNRDDRCDTEDESDEGDGPGSDEEDKVHVRSKVAEVDPLEEAEFERELRALMQASIGGLWSTDGCFLLPPPPPLPCRN